MKVTLCWSKKGLAAAAFVALGAGVSAAAQAQDVITDFTAGQPNGKYAFASWTPKTLGEIFSPPPQHDNVNIVGHLFLPPGNAKVPAVVLMHGSGGIYQAMLEYWPQQFNAAGYAVLAVDSFGPRGVASTADDQSLVPFAADITDAFAALKVLATHPRIDPKRIAVMGFSRGGTTAWRTGIERVIAAQKLPADLRFAAHIQMYSGGCTGISRLRVNPGVFAKEPMLWVHGDADDYTPIAPCQAFADEIGKAGTPVEFVVIPGAYHKFDFDDQKKVYGRALQRSKAECPIEVDIDTLYVYDRTTGKRVQGDELRDLLKNSCSATGATMQGWLSARDKANKAALAFLKKVYGQ